MYTACWQTIPCKIEKRWELQNMEWHFYWLKEEPYYTEYVEINESIGMEVLLVLTKFYWKLVL